MSIAASLPRVHHDRWAKLYSALAQIDSGRHMCDIRKSRSMRLSSRLAPCSGYESVVQCSSRGPREAPEKRLSESRYSCPAQKLSKQLKNWLSPPSLWPQCQAAAAHRYS
jgi:hypothetical protein